MRDESSYSYLTDMDVGLSLIEKLTWSTLLLPVCVFTRLPGRAVCGLLKEAGSYSYLTFCLLCLLSLLLLLLLVVCTAHLTSFPWPPASKF
jgi:hypothetical protein